MGSTRICVRETMSSLSTRLPSLLGHTISKEKKTSVQTAMASSVSTGDASVKVSEPRPVQVQGKGGYQVAFVNSWSRDPSSWCERSITFAHNIEPNADGEPYLVMMGFGEGFATIWVTGSIPMITDTAFHIRKAKMALKVSRRLEKFKTTVFTQMSILALKHQAINLGQGFPNFDGPEFIKEAAIQEIRKGKNQYARSYGVPELNSAVAARFKKDTGLNVDPEEEVTITCGCTEAIAATIMGLINPGDEVILFAPFYDSYLATLSMADAKIKTVTLRPPDFAVPERELREAFSVNTRAILINTPHNPTGKMFSRKELELIASLCIENDALAFTDEVYDKLVFEADHISMASLAGMYERTVTMNSLGKTFSFTGWRVGWAIAPAHLTWGVRQAHSFITFSAPTPMQWAALTALQVPDSYYEELVKDYRAKKDILVDGLIAVGFNVYDSQGTYFVVVDHTPFGFDNDIAFCEHLIEKVGVVAIPTSVFYMDPNDGKNLVRFTFCKDEDTLKKAIERMKANLKR